VRHGWVVVSREDLERSTSLVLRREEGEGAGLTIASLHLLVGPRGGFRKGSVMRVLYAVGAGSSRPVRSFADAWGCVRDHREIPR
jgi:hypothetical protein